MDGACDVELSSNVRLANSKARIKPTAPLSAFDKENSMEFPLDFLHYLYNYYMVCALLSHAYHVTHHVMLCDCDYVTLSHTPFCVVSPRKRKEKKRNINNNLAVLPSHNK